MTVVITSSLLFSGLYSGTDANAQTVSQAVDNAKPSQYNQIDFEPSVGIKDLKNIFKSNNISNIGGITVAGEYLTQSGYTAPITAEYIPNNDNKNTDNLKAVQKQLAQQLKTAKENLNKPKQKFDRVEFAKNYMDTSSLKVKGLPQTKKALTETQLKYYEDNGILPLPTVEEAKQEAKNRKGTPTENKADPLLDPTERAKLAGATTDEKLAVMTPSERQQYDQDKADVNITAEMTKTVTTQELEQLANSSLDLDDIAITQISFYTLGDNAQTKAIAKESNKTISTIVDNDNDNSKTKEPKPKKLTQDQIKTRKAQKTDFKLQSNKNTTKDITKNINKISVKNLPSKAEIDAQAKQGEIASKQKQKQELKQAVDNIKSTKQQFNKLEAQMYQNEGVDVPYLDDKGKEQKLFPSTTKPSNNLLNQTIGAISNILGLNTINASAKGLNNSANSLIMYYPNNTNLAVHFDSLTNGIKGKIANRTDNYGQQRFCFDNGSNRIYAVSTGTCNGITSNTLCLDDYESRMTYGDTIDLWCCSGFNDQKWYFDEAGRIASVINPNICIDGFGSLSNGSQLGLWGCHSGSNQQVRAGYNNFGSNMGMSIWSVYESDWHIENNSPVCNNNYCKNNYNAVGHSFIELWNNYGTHNTFSRWDSANYDYTCSNYSNGKVNDICDKDAITVDKELDNSNRLSDSKYSKFKKNVTQLDKTTWDYIVFGSGFRNNYYNGGQVDIGGSGTYQTVCNNVGYCYDGSVSMSRNINYNAYYGIYNGLNAFNLSNVCSGYTIKLWNAYRSSYNNFYNRNNQSYNSYSTPQDLYNALW